MSKNKDYEIRKYSPVRRILADYNYTAAHFPRIKGLIEIDVTKARERINEIEEEKNYRVSFSGWVAKCVSKAVLQNKRMNSFRKGRRKIIVFDNIDISLMVEIKNNQGKNIPLNHVIRKTETKSVKEITDEIRAVQSRKIQETEQLSRDSNRYSWLYMIVPRFIRRFVMRILLRNPFYLKKIIGTVGITSFGAHVKKVKGWAIPFGDKTLNIALGGLKEANIKDKEGKIAKREILCTTFLFDHDIIDGAPAARFVGQLTELMENAEYLDDITQKNDSSYHS